MSARAPEDSPAFIWAVFAVAAWFGGLTVADIIDRNADRDTPAALHAQR